MPLRSDSITLAAAVRQHFALSQQELARYLGLTRTQVANVETGRHGFSPAAERRLLHLAELLPPPHGGGQPLPPPTAAPAASEADPLHQRLRRCLHLAGQTRFALHGLRERQAAAEYRHSALAQLRAALLPATPPPGVLDPSFDAAHAARWLARLEADTAATLPDTTGAAQLALLEARLSALEHEANLLASLVGEA